MLEEGHALGLQAVFPQGGEEVGQALRTVDQGESPAGPGQVSGGGAQLREGAPLLAAGRSPGLPRPGGEPGGIGDHQVEGVGGKEPPVPQVACDHPGVQAVSGKGLPGRIGSGGGDLYPGEGEAFLPVQQQQAQHPRAAAQVAHLPAPAHRGEPAQGQAVAPQGKAVLRQEEGIAAQPFRPLHGPRPPFMLQWGKREGE